MKRRKVGFKFEWSEEERRAWQLPRQVTVSEWADENRFLDPISSAEPGKWRTSRTPYLEGIMNAFTDPEIEDITIMASTQIGKTESMYNCIGYVIDQDPAPVLLVMPRDDDAGSVSQNRLKPMLLGSPTLKKHLTHRVDDLKVEAFRLDRMILYFAGSNSPAALSQKPIRYLFLDEVDKYPAFSGREADPIKLATERTRTFWNRKIVKTSTPTTRQGYIFREYEKSDKRKFYIPCPECSHYQILMFPQIRWPEIERNSETIQTQKLAWYECEKCKAKIKDGQKPKMLTRGVWLTERQHIKPDGTIVGRRQHIVKAGFWINALYSPWLTFSDIAAEFLRSKDYVELLMNFVNSWLAEVWEEKSEEIKVETLAKKLDVYAPGTVPKGVLVLTAGADVQADHFYFVIRGWGVGEESWLIREGRIENWQDLTQVLFETKYFYADATEEQMIVRLACIDSAHRTAEVYDYCRQWSEEARAIKGRERLRAPWVASKIDRHPLHGGQMTKGLTLWHLDTNYFKDKIHRLVNASSKELGQWHLHNETPVDYLQQFCAEHKVLIRDKKTGRTREEWRLVTRASRNHYFDCEVYAVAAADMLGVRYLVKEDGRAKASEQRSQDQKRDRKRSNWVQGQDWKSKGGSGWLR